MKPFNRHVLIKPIEKEEQKKESLIVLPTDYKKPESPHQLAEVLGFSDDCSIDLSIGDKVVFEKRMLHKIQIDDKIHYLVLENYVYGRL
jgi:co-chaperonin GroES (HSP10)